MQPEAQIAALSISNSNAPIDENMPDGYELSGDPLKVTFLTLDKLEKAYGSKEANESDLDTTYDESHSRYLLDIHLLKSIDANNLVNRCLKYIFPPSFIDKNNKIYLLHLQKCLKCLILKAQRTISHRSSFA